MATAAQESEILAEFDEKGYVVIEDIFDPEKDFGPIIDDYTEVLDGVARRWHEQGILSSTHAGLPFCEKLIKITQETSEPWIDYFNISLPLWDVTEKTPLHFTEPIFNMMRHPRLLDAIELFIGPEIFANPIQHTRIKPPQSMIAKDKQHALNARTNWHQDLGVTLDEANETNLLTVWAPITDATEHNGCLRFIPGSHRDPLVEHCPRTDGDIEIPPELRRGEVVKVPVKAGDALFLHKLVKHDSAPNETTDSVRFSYDLRYNPIGEASGRPEWPGFVARSRAHPQAEDRDFEAVRKRWQTAHNWMAETGIHLVRRWKGGSPYCGA